MIRRTKHPKTKEFEEQLVQNFAYRCPYCDHPVSYDRLELKDGENKIQCFSCKKSYIKIISDFHEGRD